MRQSRLVGVGQGAAGDSAANTEVVELGPLRAQAGLDVAQAFAIGQLCEGHAQELIEVREPLNRIAPRILGHTASEGMPWQMIHELSEHQPSFVHEDSSGKIRKFLLH